MIAVPFWPEAKYIVMAKLDCGSTVKFSGSETASAPFGIIIDSSPPLKVTVCRDKGWMAPTPADPSKGSAIVTAVMGKSVGPKALEMRRRICEAPVDTCTFCRMVLFWKMASVSFYFWAHFLSDNLQPPLMSPLDWTEKRMSKHTYGAGGRFAASHNCGIDAHVSIQCPLGMLGAVTSAGFCSA